MKALAFNRENFSIHLWKFVIFCFCIFSHVLICPTLPPSWLQRKVSPYVREVLIEEGNSHETRVYELVWVPSVLIRFQFIHEWTVSENPATAWDRAQAGNFRNSRWALDYSLTFHLYNIALRSIKMSKI